MEVNKPKMNTTINWLKRSLEDSQGEVILRKNRTWIPVSGFRTCGCIFAIYKDDTQYCVHVGDEWEPNEEPLLGYYDINLTWDELLYAIANEYDKLRNYSIHKTKWK